MAHRVTRVPIFLTHLKFVPFLQSLRLQKVALSRDDILRISRLPLSGLSIVNPVHFEPTNVGALATMTTLRSLSLEDSEMHWPPWSLVPLGQLTSLRDLQLKVTWRQQFSWISRLMSLKTLEFASYDQLLKARALFGTLGDWAWVDTGSLRNLTSLTVLSMTGEIHDIGDLRNLTQLRRLTIQAATIQSLEPIRMATDLRKLDIRGCYFPLHPSPNSELASCLINYRGLVELCVASVSFQEGEALTFLAALSSSITYLSTQTSTPLVVRAHNLT
jgi:Leucine-rich repeat (LRR) protein